MSVNSAQNIDVKVLRTRFFVLRRLLSIATWALAFGLALFQIITVGSSRWTLWVVLLGSAFFVMVASIKLWYALTSRGPVLTLNREGLIDWRVGSDVIPWASVTKASTWGWGNRRWFVVLVMDPALEHQLPMIWARRNARPIDKLVGANGIPISVVGLDIAGNALVKAAQAYVQAAHNRTAELENNQP